MNDRYASEIAMQLSFVVSRLDTINISIIGAAFIVGAFILVTRLFK
jgi:hypothetical protein